jgi:MoaA/NifB/PqqE/SkfB family radical SAM enzyme
MISADLSQAMLTGRDVRDRLDAGRKNEAVEAAAQHAANAQCDWAVAEIASGQFERGIKRLQDAINAFPGTQLAFHNLTAALLANRQLRGPNLDAMQRHLVRFWDQYPWTRQYQPLLWMPHFLNLEFVAGKCNLKCRMCLGSNGEAHPNRLTCMTTENFRMTLAAAPTIKGVTLSACDSEPLMHPDLDGIIAAAREHDVRIEIFTNGLLLGPRNCRAIVDSQIVGSLNFSIDAATAETYHKIHHAGFDQLIGKIEMLQDMKKQRGYSAPAVSLSFVAMADTIHELPDFVRLAKRLGARRVFVGDLIGWDDRPSDNHVATDNPRCFEYVREAVRLTAETDMRIQLPERLRARSDDGEPAAAGVTPADVSLPATATPRAVGPESPDPKAKDGALVVCGWISGVWVRQDGTLDPCCMIHGIADMGNVRDGPLLHNRKFAHVKRLLLSGKVFPQCADQRMCQFVQQQHAAGIPLRMITQEELGDLYPASSPPANASPEPAEAALAV